MLVIPLRGRQPESFRKKELWAQLAGLLVLCREVGDVPVVLRLGFGESA